MKAVGVATGQLTGEPVAEPANPPPDPRAADFRRTFTRSVGLPPDLQGLPSASCFALEPDQTAACAEPDPVPASGRVRSGLLGPEQPFGYVLPGLAALAFSDADAALLAARAVSALGAALLLAGAVALSRGRARLVGVVLATTPMVVFLAGSLSVSGLEVAAAVCHGAALLALARAVPGPRGGRLAPRDRAALVAWAASGVVLAVVRPLGPAWVVGGVVLLALLVPRPRLRLLAAAAGALPATLVVAAATIVSAWWTLAVVPHPDATGEEIGAAWSGVGGALVDVGRQLVGVFGWTTVVPPLGLTLGWAAAVGALLLLGLAAGRWRERVALVLVVVAVPVLAVALEVVANAPYGFEVQGRYVLPVAVAVPLLAGEAVALAADRARASRRSPRLRPGGPAARAAAAMQTAVLPTVLLGATVAHGTGWWWSARRHAVTADGPLAFLGVPDVWAPAGGWTLWLAVLGLAGLLLVAAAVLDVLAGPASRAARPEADDGGATDRQSDGGADPASDATGSADVSDVSDVSGGPGEDADSGHARHAGRSAALPSR